MKIAILGAGALGCYYGGKLQAAGHDVAFIVRSDYEFFQTHGLEIKSVFGDLTLPKIHAYRTSDEVGPVDLVIVTLKSTANDTFAKALPPLLRKDTLVVTLQNGMGNAETIAEFVPPHHVFTGLCFVCAMREKPGHILHLEGGNIQFAPFIHSPEGSDQAKKLADLFTQVGIKSKSFDIPEQTQWYKLVWNIPFNGLCLALGGISIAELYESPENVQRAEKIMREVVQAAAARGFTLPDDLVEFHLKRTESMGAFVPSSAVDYREGRPIEYHAIWKIPLARAKQAGAQVPEWEKMDRDIRRRIGIPD